MYIYIYVGRDRLAAQLRHAEAVPDRRDHRGQHRPRPGEDIQGRRRGGQGDRDRRPRDHHQGSTANIIHIHQLFRILYTLC